MSESSYRHGFQDGWYFQDDECEDADYKKGIIDGRTARKKADKKKLKIKNVINIYPYVIFKKEG